MWPSPFPHLVLATHGTSQESLNAQSTGSNSLELWRLTSTLRQGTATSRSQLVPLKFVEESLWHIIQKTSFVFRTLWLCVLAHVVVGACCSVMLKSVDVLATVAIPHLQSPPPEAQNMEDPGKGAAAWRLQQLRTRANSCTS